MTATAPLTFSGRRPRRRLARRERDAPERSGRCSDGTGCAGSFVIGKANALSTRPRSLLALGRRRRRPRRRCSRSIIIYRDEWSRVAADAASRELASERLPFAQVALPPPLREMLHARLQPRVHDRAHQRVQPYRRGDEVFYPRMFPRRRRGQLRDVLSYFANERRETTDA